MSSHETIWVAAAISISLFLTLCYAASASAAWPRARPRIPLWFFLLVVFFPPFFPFLILFLFLTPTPYVVDQPTLGAPPRVARIVVVQPAGAHRMSRI